MRAKYTHDIGERHAGGSVCKAAVTALRIVRKYRRQPTVAQLRQDFGMSRGTAYRWLAAWKYVADA